MKSVICVFGKSVKNGAQKKKKKNPMNLEIMGKSEKRWRVLRILLSETIDFSVAPI